jgi:hypothetical protein
MTLFCEPRHRSLHWCARLVATDEVLAMQAAGDPPHGSLRISADTGQRTPFHAGVQMVDKPVDVRNLGRPDASGGWVIGGQALLSCPVEGHYGLGIYGTAPGLRVLWAAVTVTLEMSAR